MQTSLIEMLANSLPVQQLLKNQAVTDLLGNVLSLRNTVEEFLEDKIVSTLKMFEVPSRKEITQMEKKIHQLENELLSMHRRALIKKLKSENDSPKRIVKKAAKKVRRR